jgi:hypothetical protein
LNAQEVIRGKITDAGSGEPLIGATIYQKSNPEGGTSTDFDGNFSLKIKNESSPTIIISYMGYKTFEKKIEMGKKDVLVKNFVLYPDNVALDEVVVKGRSDRSKDVVLKTVQMKSAGTFDFISKETISKTGDSQVDDAVKRVTGVSTVQGFITVRGVADRYVKTRINGARIPTLDPFTNNIKLDLFSTSLIDNIIISKTQRPDLPGDWAGAYLSIETIDYPDQFMLNFSSSIGYNTQTTFRNVLSSQRGPTDWLGYDNGFRDINHPGPDKFPEYNNGSGQSPRAYDEFLALGNEQYMNSLGIDETHLGNYSGSNFHSLDDNIYYRLNMVELGLLAPAHIYDDQAVYNATQDYATSGLKQTAFEGINSDLVDFSHKLPNNWFTTQRRAPLNTGYSLSIGDQLTLFGKPLGLIAGLRYSSSMVSTEWSETYLRYSRNFRIFADKFREETYETNSWNALVSASYKFNLNHSINFVFMPNFTGTNRARHDVDWYTIVHHEDYIYTNNEIQLYEERQQMIYQFRSNHFFPVSKIKVDIESAYTTGKSNIPDYKDIGYESFDSAGTQLTFGNRAETGNEREFRYLNDDIFDTRLFVEIPFKEMPGYVRKIKLGGQYLFNKRETQQFLYHLYGDELEDKKVYSNLENFFDSEKFEIQGREIPLYYQINAKADDFAIGERKITSGFAMIDYTLIPKIRITGGLRVEYSDMFSDLKEYHEAGYPAGDTNRVAPPGVVLGDGMTCDPSVINETNYLPSVGVLLKIADNDKLLFNTRLNYGQSLARPSIREVTPYARKDFELENYVFGNPFLKTTDIDNYDIRFETFFASGEYISLSGFYKLFVNPITLYASLQKGYSWLNSDNSNLYGIEIEGKKKIIKKLFFSANATFVYASTSYSLHIDGNHVGGTYPMYGQAPYIFNLLLDYTLEKQKISTAISYNVQGPKVAAITFTTPPIYEMPRKLLDFKISKEFINNINVSFKIRNILNAPVQWQYDSKGNNNWSHSKYNKKLKTIWNDAFGIKTKNYPFDWSVYNRFYTYGTNYELGVTYNF